MAETWQATADGFDVRDEDASRVWGPDTYGPRPNSHMYDDQPVGTRPRRFKRRWPWEASDR